MTLHLVDSWNYLGSLQQTLSFGDRKVGDPNSLDQAFADKILHCLSKGSIKIKLSIRRTLPSFHKNDNALL